MKKLIVALSLFAGLCPGSSFAGSKEWNNRIQLTTGGYFAKNIDSEGPGKMFHFLDAFGISYQRRILPKLSIGVSYSKWYDIIDGLSGKHDSGNGYSEADVNKKGEVFGRYKYQFIDLAANFSLLQYKKHELFISAGPSYCWGENIVPDLDFVPGGDIRFSEKVQGYFGAIAQAGYNYRILKDRINIGISEVIRYYPTVPVQFNCNINVGYNFGDFWKKK